MELRSSDRRPGTAWLDKSASDRSARILIACVPETVTERNPWLGMGKMGFSWAEVRTIRKEGRHTMNVGEWWNGLPNSERTRTWVQFKARRFIDPVEEKEQALRLANEETSGGQDLVDG